MFGGLRMDAWIGRKARRDSFLGCTERKNANCQRAGAGFSGARRKNRLAPLDIVTPIPILDPSSRKPSARGPIRQVRQRPNSDSIVALSYVSFASLASFAAKLYFASFSPLAVKLQRTERNKKAGRCRPPFPLTAHHSRFTVHRTQSRSSTHPLTDASAFGRFSGFVPPACAISGRPPPLPPTCCAT